MKELHTKQKVQSAISKYIYKRNRTHYLKWELYNFWSIRYYFTNDPNPEFNGKWIMKNHKTKQSIILSRAEAVAGIQHFAQQEEPKEYFSAREFNIGYRRVILKPNKGTDCFIDSKAMEHQ